MSGLGPGFVLKNEHVVLLVFMWILLTPGTLFTIDLYAMSFKLNFKRLFGTILPQLSIMVLAWAAIVYFTAQREIPIDPYLAGASASDEAGVEEVYNMEEVTPTANQKVDQTANAVEGGATAYIPQNTNTTK